jgi:hypothetical protein
MRTLTGILIALILSSCTATYDSPRTGIKYRVEVPLSVLDQYLKIEKPQPIVSPQK